MNQPNPGRLWIDGDACPRDIKTILYRAVERCGINATVVANQQMRVPPGVDSVAVPPVSDAADDYIVEHLSPGDLVITADVPLAAAVVERGALAIGPRGEEFTPDNVQEKLAQRNLMDQLRGAGMAAGGPAQIDATDKQRFSNALDRLLTAWCKRG